jgi:uncharacterized protein (DUF885 family)
MLNNRILMSSSFMLYHTFILPLPFCDKPDQADYYWQALVQIAQNNQEQAQAIITALQARQIPSASITWKEPTSDAIDSFFDHYFIVEVSRDPQTLTALGLFEKLGVQDHNSHLNPVSPAHIKDRFTRKKHCLSLLEQYDYENLTDDQKLSYKIFRWLLTHGVEGEKFLFHDYFVNHMDGVIAELSMVMTQYHPLNTKDDVRTYIDRLRAIAEQLSQTIELLKHQKSSGIKPPDFALKKVMLVLEKTTPSDVTNCVFYTHLANALSKIDGINKKEILTQAHEILEHQVYPAYRKLHELCTQIVKEAPSNNGVWALPHGDEYYAHMLKHHTTTNLTADEIHQIGLQEVSKIHKLMRTILKSVGIKDSRKTVGELMHTLSKDPQHYFPNTAQGKQQCLQRFHSILERCNKELVPFFDMIPKAPLRIQQTPAHEEDGAPIAYYVPPSIDGSRPGTFFANLGNMATCPMYGMETLTVHEAVPGHHFQLSLQQEMDLPILRRIGNFNAYTEGWALYVEKLAYEKNFFSSPLDQLGHLQDELLRAVRLVVDTGIHSKRWSREKAIDYMYKATGYDMDAVVAEIERYFVLPGQACSYKIGQLKILELRKKLLKKQGKNFDIKKFHNVVLKLGACPLEILEEELLR